MGKSAFEENDVTGWKKYPAEVCDKKGNLVEDYSILAVTGRSGPIDDSLSAVMWKSPPVPKGTLL